MERRSFLSNTLGAATMGASALQSILSPKEAFALANELEQGSRFYSSTDSVLFLSPADANGLELKAGVWLIPNDKRWLIHRLRFFGYSSNAGGFDVDDLTQIALRLHSVSGPSGEAQSGADLLATYPAQNQGIDAGFKYMVAPQVEHHSYGPLGAANTFHHSVVGSYPVYRTMGPNSYIIPTIRKIAAIALSWTFHVTFEFTEVQSRY